MNVDQDETIREDVIEPAAEGESWLAEQVRLVALEDGFEI